MANLHVNDITIPESELEWSFSTSGGPGGQHANRSATRAELRFDLGASPAVPDALRSTMLERLGNRAVGGVVTVTADDSRSQWRNRQLARRRLADLLSDSMRRPRQRRPTTTPRAAKRRRLEDKKRRGELKQQRRPPELD